MNIPVPIQVKAFFNNEIRRFALPTGAFYALADILKGLFAVEGEALQVLYKDDDGDMITMSSDEELQHAVLLCKGVLRIMLVPKNKKDNLGLRNDAVSQPAKNDASGEPSIAPLGYRKWGGHHCKTHGRGHFKGLEMKDKNERQAKDCTGGKKKLIARHVKDVTVEDGTEFPPNTSFAKIWRVRNEGIEWPVGCRLLFVGRNSDRMGAPDSVEIPGPVLSNQELDISVGLVAPAEPGRYTGYWRMCTLEGKKFGQRLWVSITVANSSSSSPGENGGSFQTPDETKNLDEVVKKIQGMGIGAKIPKIVRLLRKHNGNIDMVVQILVKKSKKHDAK